MRGRSKPSRQLPSWENREDTVTPSHLVSPHSLLQAISPALSHVFPHTSSEFTVFQRLRLDAKLHSQSAVAPYTQASVTSASALRGYINRSHVLPALWTLHSSTARQRQQVEIIRNNQSQTDAIDVTNDPLYSCTTFSSGSDFPPFVLNFELHS